MNTADVVEILRNFKADFAEKYGIKKNGLFGSFARAQQTEMSDIDVVVTLKESDFFTLVAIQEELEKRNHPKKADLIQEKIARIIRAIFCSRTVAFA